MIGTAVGCMLNSTNPRYLSPSEGRHLLGCECKYHAWFSSWRLERVVAIASQAHVFDVDFGLGLWWVAFNNLNGTVWGFWMNGWPEAKLIIADAVQYQDSVISPQFLLIWKCLAVGLFW